MNYWGRFKILVVAILTVLFMGVTANAVAADETQSSTVIKGRMDSGYIRLKSTTDSRGITKTRGYIDGRYIRFTTKTVTPAPAVKSQVYVGREFLSERYTPKKD